MTTIVEPKQHIAQLWGKQWVREDQIYRLMKYVLQVEHEGKVLLHNVVTGQLVVLEDEEANMLEVIPTRYSSVMEQLVIEHYLVPVDYDEHQQVINLRSILRKFVIESSLDPIALTRYTILPTTACNARCYYCYEHGIPAFTMTKQIADDTVKFIADHCGIERKISIRWYGGEPTVAAYRIDQICKGIRERDIQYSSSITTNGYLFDGEMVSRARELWNLKNAMICVDGTEKNYNEVKAFVNAKDNPYQRVLRNIGLLLEQGVSVSLRMNFDLGNYRDFKDVLTEALQRFQGNKLLQVYAFPVKGEYPDKYGRVMHGSEDWFDEKIAELNDLARAADLFHRTIDLPSLFFSTCNAGSPHFMVITPQGELARCTGVFSHKDQIVGSVTDGVMDQTYWKSWNQFAELSKCVNCPLFPSCVQIERCPGKNDCFLKETFRQYEEVVKNRFKHFVNKNGRVKGEMPHGITGTEGRICLN